jgi:hypothetical protein
MIIVVWIGVAVAIGVLASRWGRNGLGWALFGIVLSPLLSGIFLLAVGKREVDQYGEIRITPQYAVGVVKAARGPLAILAHLVGWSLLVLITGAVIMNAIVLIRMTPPASPPPTVTAPLKTVPFQPRTKGL